MEAKKCWTCKIKYRKYKNQCRLCFIKRLEAIIIEMREADNESDSDSKEYYDD